MPKNLIEIFADNLRLGCDDDYYLAASHVLRSNIVQGNALEGKDSSRRRRDIVFPEWTYEGNGKFRRCDFRFKDLMRHRELSAKGSSSENQPYHRPIEPARNDYPPTTVGDLAIIGDDALEKAA